MSEQKLSDTAPGVVVDASASERLVRWMTAYRQAWETNDPDDIRALFSEGGSYRTEPHSEAWTGHEAIVAGWLDAADSPGDATFEWTHLVEQGDLSVITGTTVYRERPTYSNLWVIRFDPDGRARQFTEWWMDQSES